MDTVARLEATTGRHAEALETLAGQMAKTTAQVVGLTTIFGGLASSMRVLSQRMDDLSKRMDDMSSRMDDMSSRMEQGEQRLQALEGDMERQHEMTLSAASIAREQQALVGRLGKLIAVVADTSNDRFDEIEARVDALEKKTG
jgi:methyl-accepting chemotaxis protein-1 (serine sensor receptor)